MLKESETQLSDAEKAAYEEGLKGLAERDLFTELVTRARGAMVRQNLAGHTAITAGVMAGILAHARGDPQAAAEGFVQVLTGAKKDEHRFAIALGAMTGKIQERMDNGTLQQSPEARQVLAEMQLVPASPKASFGERLIARFARLPLPEVSPAPGPAAPRAPSPRSTAPGPARPS
ncbi:MAG: hypothetical protein M3O22_02920 [Pseudomonadota bacterium]|nr:hypothetical protein [Pseudomonadota bacterium]